MAEPTVPNRPGATRFLAVACALVTGAAPSACSGLTPKSEDSDGQVVVRVQGRPPATDQAGRAQFDRLVADFEKANPGIDVQGSDNVWDPLTFSAQLAGGGIEDVIKVPLTEPQGLIARRQALPITEYLKDWDHYDEFNPQVLQPLQDDAGDLYGIPLAPFAQGLVYNRALFTAAGLDPDQPPSTWDEVRRYAKQITERTGKVGFLHESKGNTGGWQLTMLSYTHGGDMEREQGGRQVAAFNSQPTRDALNLLKDMRWTDNSMGSNQLNDQDDTVRRFAAGEVGMFMGTPGTYRLAKMNFGMKNTADYGVTALPQAGGDATLAGADVFMVPASVSEEKAAAAVKWLVFAYAQPQYDPDVAARQAKELAGDPDAAVGVPTLPLFTAEQQDRITAAIKPYANVELAHFQPWLDGTPELELRPEPPVAAQKLYAILDPVVQAVLTDRGADIDALLTKAESDANAMLDAEQS